MNTKTFNEVMNTKALTPNRMPPMQETAGVSAATAWHDAISGKGLQPGLADTKNCAAQWLGQFDQIGVDHEAPQNPAPGVQHAEGPAQTVEEAQVEGRQSLRSR